MTRTTGVHPNRRSFIRAIGVGTTAIGVSGSFSGVGGAQTEDDEPAGYLSLIYDDGPVEDYDMFRTHQKYDAPGCVAACAGLVGSDLDWLNADQLREMHDAGWEVMSHTVDHRALGEVPIARDIEEGDTRIYPDANITGRFDGDPIVVFDEDSEAEATVAGNGEDGTGPYIDLEAPIDASFTAAYTTRVRYTDEFTEEILADSRAQLDGIVGEGRVTNFIYPYERADGFVSEIISEYYDATPSKDGVGLNPEYEPDPYDLSRRYMETDHMTDADIESYLDSIAAEPDWGILAGHSEYETLTTERIDFVLRQAQERNIAVLTVQEALDRFGVVPAPGPTTDEDGVGDDNGDTGDDGDESTGFLARIFAFFRALFA